MLIWRFQNSDDLEIIFNEETGVLSVENKYEYLGTIYNVTVEDIDAMIANLQQVKEKLQNAHSG